MTLVARTWRARIGEDRIRDYLVFLEERSLPMFRSLPGCLGAVFIRDRDVVTVMSVWADRSDVDALSTNETYADTVAALDRSGILASSEATTIHNADAFVTRPDRLESAGHALPARPDPSLP